MFRFPLGSLCVGCALLAVTFVAAEEMAGGAARFAARPAPAAECGPLPAGADVDHGRLPADGQAAALDSVPRGAAGPGRKLHRICRVTAYCQRGTTAAGVPTGIGQCAAPADIPLGSTVYIPALDRTFVVTDRTHRRFRHSTVDLFIASKRTCRDFGRHYLECEFTLVTEPPAYGTLRLPSAGG